MVIEGDTVRWRLIENTFQLLDRPDRDDAVDPVSWALSSTS